jgi:hypothetical protein
MWFSRPTIQIHVSPDHWTFTCEARSWSGAAVVHLDQLSAQGVVMAIGTAPPGGASCVTVPLFGDCDSSINKSAVLEAFIRHGLRQVLRRISLQPRLQVIGAHTLRPCLQGDERLLLRTVLVSAGMRPDAIEFVD